MPMVEIRWKCPFCDHEHTWEWDEKDSPELDPRPGIVYLKCDACDLEAPMYYLIGQRRYNWNGGPPLEQYPEDTSPPEEIGPGHPEFFPRLIAKYEDADPPLLQCDGYDDCCVGVCHRFGGVMALAYSRPKMIRKMMEEDGMSEEDANEHFEFNIIGAWVGETTPFFIDDEV